MPPKYTIAIIHLNMVETVTRSLTSILEQIDDRFEVIVVDDGSTDGSVEILQWLEKEYDNLRVFTDAGNKNHGEARGHAVKLASGEYILASLDADDEFTPCIPQFTSLYHELEGVKENDFLLLGYGLYMAPRSLLLEIPYRSLGYGEDRDLYRRLLAEDAFLSLSHHPIRNALGYQPSRVQKIKIGVETITSQFRSGLYLRPYLKWAFEEMVGKRNRISSKRGFLHLVVAPLAYLLSYRHECYECPEKFRDIGAYKDALMDAHMTLSEIEDQFGIKVDRDKIGPRGVAVFDTDIKRTLID
ncbi:glycosyltransferase family 2 protein [Haloferax denitrificans]|uniref:glycosyltransferase family 2 protein n=1 Tax=Haloferax denitrificans TaxID=35745 RepID=UPI003C6EDFB9